MSRRSIATTVASAVCAAAAAGSALAAGELKNQLPFTRLVDTRTPAANLAAPNANPRSEPKNQRPFRWHR
jgi:hypothetical protein